MPRPSALLGLPDGSSVTLHPGDIVGRMWGAALRIDHARVSEAHSLLSLRGESLWLLKLRGGLWVDGEAVQEVELAPGLRVHLAPDLPLDVIDVELPDQVLVLVTPDGASVPLTGSVYSLVAGEELVTGRYVAGAAGWIWSNAQGLTLALPGGAATPVEPGRWTVGGHTFEVRALPVEDAAPNATEASAGPVPLRIVARYDVVHVHVGGEIRELAGMPARIVSELAAAGGIVSCDAVARSVCGAGKPDAFQLRKRLDKNLWTLRRKLVALGVRTDLVRTTGTGLLELFLYPGDEVVDET